MGACIELRAFGEGVVKKWNYEPYSKLGLTIQKKKKRKATQKNDKLLLNSPQFQTQLQIHFLS